jgi:acetylornithine deacetylase
MIEDRGEVFPSLAIDKDSAGIELIQTHHKQMFEENVKISMSPSVNDGGWLGYKGIPTVIYGPGELIEAHAINESVSIKQLSQYTKIVMNIIYDWCHTKKER